MLAAKIGHRHTVFALFQYRQYLNVTKSRFLHLILLVYKRPEKSSFQAVGFSGPLPWQHAVDGDFGRAGNSTERVCNFEVSGTHTYFAGDVGAWVHNPKPAIHLKNGGKADFKSPITKDDLKNFSTGELEDALDILLHSKCVRGAAGPSDAGHNAQIVFEKQTIKLIKDKLGR